MARSASRSASSGRFVSKAAAARWPGKTTTERAGARVTTRRTTVGGTTRLGNEASGRSDTTRTVSGGSSAPIRGTTAPSGRTTQGGVYDIKSSPARHPSAIEVQAARLREVTDSKLGKTTPDWVKRLAKGQR